ncbi:SMP-30/gluconolactonase/LRE family protein [Qingshengfaniella alkalisoli]|nr:SMP-30/gluconolactonase/LRE family protein [Qingshengfaniella alkalisoli]
MATVETKGADSLRKALNLLDIVKDRPGGAEMRDLVAASGLSRPTAYRMVAALTEEGFLKLDDSTRRITFGPKLLALAQGIWSDTDLRGGSRNELTRLAQETGATALLMVRSGGWASCIDLVEGQRGGHGWQVGMVRSVTQCAGGLAILAYGDWSDLDRRQKDLDVDDPRQLKSTLGVVRSRFYAVDTLANESGNMGVAAPIFDISGRAVGAVCLYGDAQASLHALGSAVVQAARDISEARGGYPFDISLPTLAISNDLDGVDLIADSQCLIGDNPCFDDERLFWIDILGPSLYRLDRAGEEPVCLNQTEVAGALLRLGPGRMLLAQQTRLALLDGSGNETWQRRVSGLPPGFRYNDGALDPVGRIWLGAMDMAVSRSTGLLHRYDDLDASPISLPGFSLPNGISFSPDYERMFVVDSMEKLLCVFDYDADIGAATLRERITLLEDCDGRPSGLAPGPDGTFFTCHWDGGAVLQIDSIGRTISSYSVPVPRPSGLVYDGENDRLIVTSARVRLSETDTARFPKAGGTFAVPLSK